MNSPAKSRDAAELFQGSSKAAVAVAVFEEGLRSIKERMALAAYERMGADADELRVSKAERTRRERRGRDTDGD